MSKKEKSYNRKDELTQMAKDWQCEKNELIITLIENYDNQLLILDKCYAELNNPQCEIYTNREDRYRGKMTAIHPLLQHLPKLVDASNKTASLIVKTITAVGTKPEIKMESALTKFLDDEDDEDGAEE